MIIFRITFIVVLKAIGIIESKEGSELREKLLANAIFLPNGLMAKGMAVLDNPSAIVLTLIGSKTLIRVVAKLLLDKDILVNLLEYPAVPSQKERQRLLAGFHFRK